MRQEKACLLLWVAIGLSGCAGGTEGEVGIISICATDATLRISCSVPRSQLELIELKPYQPYDKNQSQPVIWQGIGRSDIVIDRYEGKRDLIYSKFLIIDGLSKEPIGSSHYVTDFSSTTRRTIELPRPESIKGLSCIVDIDDAVDLGVKYVHENIYINDIVDPGNNDPEAVWEFAGEQIPLNMDKIRGYDQRIRRFTEAGIGVFVVFLNKMPEERKPNDPLLCPDSDCENSPTHLGAFNVTTDEGLKYYLAALEFLTDRYTRPDAQYGLISSLIIGNELQQHWVWYNMGDASEQKVIQDYLIALRMGWLALQKYHPDLRVYVSMDHHWTKRGFRNNPLREIPGDVLLEKLAQGSRHQGDFPWNVAFHPYPEDLFEPQFWYDKSPTNELSTPKITFKNIEVLPRFMKQENLLYEGRMRDIALTEQGFHTPDGPDGEQIQAAAYAYAYYKVSQIPEISAFILHRHVDHHQEGGLKLGVWTSDLQALSPPESPLKKKFIWEVFKYADTPEWERHFEFAKLMIGIKEWSDAPTNTGSVTKSAFTVDKDSVVYDFIAEFDKAEKVNNIQCEAKDILRAAGWTVPAIFQHPPAEGVGELTYQVKLPRANQGEKLSLLFETILAHESGDGVRFSISINGSQIWTAIGTKKTPVSYDIDLTEWSGREVGICFMVDKITNADYDWSYWINPIVVRQ